jgi:hypothetical protein
MKTETVSESNLSESNLTLVSQARAKLTPDERRMFESALVGAVSNYLSPEEMHGCVETALRCARELH